MKIWLNCFILILLVHIPAFASESYPGGKMLTSKEWNTENISNVKYDDQYNTLQNTKPNFFYNLANLKCKANHVVGFAKIPITITGSYSMLLESLDYDPSIFQYHLEACISFISIPSSITKKCTHLDSSYKTNDRIRLDKTLSFNITFQNPGIYPLTLSGYLISPKKQTVYLDDLSQITRVECNSTIEIKG